MASLRLEQLITEYYIKRTEANEIYLKSKSPLNFNKLHAFSNLVLGLFNRLNTELQKSTQYSYMLFNNYVYNPFTFDQNEFSMTENIKKNLSMIDMIPEDGKVIIMKYLNALDTIDLNIMTDENKQFKRKEKH